MADLIQLRRDTEERWRTINPILAEGEVGLVLDNVGFKIGDGVNSWNDLPLLGIVLSGTTSQRPTNVKIGSTYFDISLNKPIWWNGSTWIDATGQKV